MKDGYNNYLTCIGVSMEGIVYVPKHRTTDSFKHYSAGICVPCKELVKKLRISQKLSFNGIEAELLKAWEYKGTPLIETPMAEVGK